MMRNFRPDVFNQQWGCRGGLGSLGGTHWIVGAFIGLAILATIIVVVLLAIRSARHHGTGFHYGQGQGTGTPAQPTGGTPGQSGTASPDAGLQAALKILHERYARGEIDEETYERMKQNLNK